jgi:hypothetical protein
VRSEEKRTQNQYRRGKLEPETTEHEWLWITTLDKQAFPATLVRRLGSGLQGNGGGGDQVMPWTNPYYDHMIYGLSDFDHKHRIVTSYVWELPFAKRMKGVGAMVLDGWQLTGVQQYQTGSPMTVVSGKDNSRTSLGRDRAISAGADPGRPSGVDPILQWFNRAAFATNPAGTFGTLGKGTLRLADGNYARITQTLANAGSTQGDMTSGGPRIIQLALKLTF